MTQFLQLHLLTAYPAANLNRDDTGRPKTLTFGGAERLRVSSQSLKRAFRTNFRPTLPIGDRSREFGRIFRDGLIAEGVEQSRAVEITKATIGKAGKNEGDNKKAKRPNVLASWDKPTEPSNLDFAQAVHLGPDEQIRLTQAVKIAAQTGALPEKEAVMLLAKPRAADIAMFGRMLADNPAYNVEAAVQVAHAFTTHRVAVEDDYYTAVDDLKAEREEADKGAGFIGVQEFGSGLFYLYICIDTELLADNLAGDEALAGDTVEALITAAATVSPSGKQNAFASRAKADYILLETGEGQPRTLGGAFQKPVRPTGDAGMTECSIERLDKLRDGFRKAYGEDFSATIMDVHAGEGSLAEVITAARSAMA